MAGAVQAIYQPSTTPLVLGLGHAALNLRYALLTTTVSTAGIVAGLPFGPLGVAVGYACAVAALVPVEWIIRRRLLGLALSTQVRNLVPGFHVAAWVAGTYTLVAVSIEGHNLVVLACGSLLALATGLGVMRAVHRSQLSEVVLLTNRIIGRSTQGAVVEGAGRCRESSRDRRVHDGPHAPLPRDALDESQTPRFVGLAHAESMRHARRPFLR